MPVPQYGMQTEGPTCFSKMKMGFMMGFTIGMVAGVVFGGFSALRSGYRGVELIRTVGKGSVSGGGTFGVFMAVGTGIRC